MGDLDKLPLPGEYSQAVLMDDEVALFSGDDISGCFHLYELPQEWWKWFVFSKPRRAPAVGGISRLEYVAVKVIPMGWLSAVGIVQHMHRRIATVGLKESAGLAQDRELRRDAPFPLRHLAGARWYWSMYVDDSEETEFVKSEQALELVGTVSDHQLMLRRALGARLVGKAIVGSRTLRVATREEASAYNTQLQYPLLSTSAQNPHRIVV